MSAPPPNPSGSGNGPGYETADLDPGGIGLIGTMFVLGLIISSLVTALYYQAVSIRTQHREGALLVPVPHQARTFPTPRLQARPPHELAAFRQRENAMLENYGWVDREKGVVRIPIDRAMDLLVQRGLPTLKGAEGGEEGPTWEEIMRQRALQGAGGDAERRLP